MKQAELGLPVADLIRQVGISEQTFYRWKKQYGGLESDQVRALKLVLDENARLKKLVAELSLDKAVLQDVLWPALMKEVVAYVTAWHGYSQRRGLLFDASIDRPSASRAEKIQGRNCALAAKSCAHRYSVAPKGGARSQNLFT